jgi:hypothetical protein
LQLSSIPIALPLARSLWAGAAVAPPKRLVIFMQNNGTKRCNFWPQPPSPGAGVYPIADTPILTSLFTNDGMTDNGLKAKANLIRGLQVTNDVSNTGNQHDFGFARMFTGAKLAPTPDGAPWGGSISVDQILARDWNVRSLTTAVYASEIEAHPKTGFDHRASFSYVAAQQLKLPTIDPITAYANTFPQAGPGVQQRLALRKSVLDSVTGDLQEIAGRLGADDGKKLDYHLTAVRDAENKLSDLLKGSAACAWDPGAPRDFNGLPPGLTNNELNLETYVPDMMDAFVTLIGAALKCGLTRVASLQLGYGGGNWAFAWRGMGLNNHEAAHHDTSDDVGTTPDAITNTARVTTINQFYADVVRRLAVDLDSAPEGAGTMLDNTLIVWGNEFGRGDHQTTDVPNVFIGLVGNGIKSGGNVHDLAAARGAQQPHTLLGYHMLNALGHATAGFGDIADMSPYAIDNF